MQDKYCGHYDIHPIQSQCTKVAAVGRDHGRGGATFDRGTSFVLSFVLALNRVNVVAVTTLLVLHAGVITHYNPCPLGLHVPSSFVPCALAAFAPQGSRGVWRAAGSPIVHLAKHKIKVLLKLILSLVICYLLLVARCWLSVAKNKIASKFVDKFIEGIVFAYVSNFVASRVWNFVCNFPKNQLFDFRWSLGSVTYILIIVSGSLSSDTG